MEKSKKRKAKEERGRKEKKIYCPLFTYVIFHGLLWGVELFVVGTATQGVNQPKRICIQVRLPEGPKP